MAKDRDELLAKARAINARGRLKRKAFIDKAVDDAMFGTVDPENISPFGDGKPIPAVTTMLHGVCGGDPVKFMEASRLVELFVRHALEGAVD